MCEAQSVNELATEPDDCSGPRMHLAEGGNWLWTVTSTHTAWYEETHTCTHAINKYGILKMYLKDLGSILPKFPGQGWPRPSVLILHFLLNAGIRQWAPMWWMFNCMQFSDFHISFLGVLSLFKFFKPHMKSWNVQPKCFRPTLAKMAVKLRGFRWLSPNQPVTIKLTGLVCSLCIRTEASCASLLPEHGVAMAMGRLVQVVKTQNTWLIELWDGDCHLKLVYSLFFCRSDNH